MLDQKLWENKLKIAMEYFQLKKLNNSKKLLELGSRQNRWSSWRFYNEFVHDIANREIQFSNI